MENEFFSVTAGIEMNGAYVFFIGQHRRANRTDTANHDRQNFHREIVVAAFIRHHHRVDVKVGGILNRIRGIVTAQTPNSHVIYQRLARHGDTLHRGSESRSGKHVVEMQIFWGSFPMQS